MTLMLIKSFTFQLFVVFFQFMSRVSPSISLCFLLFSLPSIFTSIDQWTLERLASPPQSLQSPLSATSLSWCCFSHCSLCSSPFPTFRPVSALTESDSGRDDSRARFSLWVYYLCSGPFKTTQNGPGSQCGEFILTSCLLLLLLLFLVLSRSCLPSSARLGNR